MCVHVCMCVCVCVCECVSVSVYISVSVCLFQSCGELSVHSCGTAQLSNTQQLCGGRKALQAAKQQDRICVCMFVL